MSGPDIPLRRYSAGPWLWSIVVYMVVVFAPLAVIFTFVALRNRPPSWLGEYFVPVYLCVMIGFALWFCWGLPLLCSGRIRYLKFRSTPKHLLTSYRMAAWMPAVIILALVLIELVGMPIESYYYMGFWEWPTVTEAAVSLGVLAVIATICFAVARVVRRRMLRTIRAASLCFPCGYDLRGSAGPACPECGEPIPPEVARAIQTPAKPDAIG